MLISAWCVSGINFNSIIKKNKENEAKALIFILSIIMSYCLTNFVIDFLSLSSIL